MLLTVIESPYAGNVERNLSYLRDCLRDSLLRGEAPIASHGLYTQQGVLRDEIPSERLLGMAAGHAWIVHCDQVVVYIDLGISDGMQAGIDRAHALGKLIQWRSLPYWKQGIDHADH